MYGNGTRTELILRARLKKVWWYAKLYLRAAVLSFVASTFVALVTKEHKLVPWVEPVVKVFKKEPTPKPKCLHFTHVNLETMEETCADH